MMVIILLNILIKELVMVISELEKAAFCQQLAMMIDGGISLDDGIEMISEQVDNNEYKQLLLSISKDITQGNNLSTALSNSNSFDDYMVNMVTVGETSGYLDKVLNQLSTYYQRNHNTKSKIYDALTYPFILIIMMLVVIIVLVFKILPLFKTVLNNMGLTISSLSNSLMNISQVLAIIILIVLVLIIIILTISLLITKNKNYSMITLLEKFKVTSKVSYSLAIAQFAYCLSLLTNSGYNQNDTLDMCYNMCDNTKLKPVLNNIKQESENSSLTNALLKYPVFTNTYNRLLILGLKSGHFEQSITTVANEYEKQVDITIDNFINMIEPILVVVMSLIVGIILLSVMLPLTSIMSSL